MTHDRAIPTDGGTQAHELLEAAWELLTRAHARDEDAPAGWVDAVEDWRSRYHALLQITTGDLELPAGYFARVELPGYRNHTGWVTEETRFGAQMAVIRGWTGQVIAEVFIGPGCQVVRLPTPLKRPEPQTAIEVGPHSAAAWLGDDEPDDDPPINDELGPEVDDQHGMTDYRHEGEAPF